MNTFIIGDLQGCFDTLQTLLQEMNFNPVADRLGFVGDLVNRGPKSLETIRFVMQLKNPVVVLGNHDLHLLALHYQHAPSHIPHTLIPILEAPDCKEIIEWLVHKPFMYTTGQFVMVHAGIPPQWSFETAQRLANEASQALQQNPKTFLSYLYGDKPNQWHDDLTGSDRLRYIVNAFTRMRFCDANGRLDLSNKTRETNDPSLKPWFLWRQTDKPLCFGHWASLRAQCNQPNIYALDTGCYWGGSLTAIRVDDWKRFSVKNQEC